MAESALPLNAIRRLPFFSEEDTYLRSNQTMDVSVSFRDFKPIDSTLRSAVLVVYTQETASKEFTEVSRTKIVRSAASQEFAGTFRLENFFEKSADNLKLALFQSCDDNEDLTRLCEETLTIGDIVTSPDRLFEYKPRNLSAGKPQINIKTVVPQNCRNTALMSWEGKKTDKGQKLFGEKLLKLKISKINEDRSYTTCLESHPEKNKWEDLEVPIQLLCNDDEDAPIRVQVFEVNKHKEESALVGDFSTYLAKLKKGPGKVNRYACKKQIKNENETAWETTANFSLTDFRIRHQPSVLDFLQEGMRVSFVVGIDFTASNKKHTDPESLHYLYPDHPNEYELAIKGVADVLQQYNKDKKFPSFGFGARVPPNDKISHKFPINMSKDPNCDGVDGILQAYRNCVTKVKFDRPANLAPLIRHVTDMAKQVEGASNYYVLLILTDGEYTDRDAAMEAIVEAAETPMSIIIVGVGKKNFDEMVELDGDDERLSYRGKKAERDIVQFVPLLDHLSKDGSQILNQKRFIRSVLEEVPDQLIDYMTTNNLSPGMGVLPAIQE